MIVRHEPEKEVFVQNVVVWRCRDQLGRPVQEKPRHGKPPIDRFDRDAI